MKLSDRLSEVIRKFGMDYDDYETVAEAASIVRRVEEAPSGEVWQHAYIGGQRTSSIIITREPEDGLAVIGKRVRIVKE